MHTKRASNALERKLAGRQASKQAGKHLMNISKSARGSHNVPFSPVCRRDGSEFDQPLPGAFRHLSLNRERELHNPFNTDGA